MGILWALALPAQAYTEVTNTVTTEANTGGGGGTATVNTKIYTEVNGEVITDIDETKTSTDGSPVVIEKEITYSDNWRDIPTDIDMVSETRTETSVQVKEDSVMMNEDDVDAMEEVMEEMTEERLEDVEARSEAQVTVFARIKVFFKTYVFWWL